jgi:hypothetical protein
MVYGHFLLSCVCPTPCMHALASGHENTWDKLSSRQTQEVDLSLEQEKILPPS